MKNEFGFTNEAAEFERVQTFKRACLSDGWTIAATYQHESIERAFKLTKDGFLIQGLTRTNEPDKKWRYEASLSCWGPDSLAISLPDTYDFESIKIGVRACDACDASDVDTHRYSFAGRCCAKCLPEMKRKHERPGWCD